MARSTAQLEALVATLREEIARLKTDLANSQSKLADCREGHSPQVDRLRAALEAYWPMVVEDGDEGAWRKLARDALAAPPTAE